MNTVYLQLGSNLGEREQLLDAAILAIELRVGSIMELSKVYESSPWRVDGQPNYLNKVLKVKTKLEAEIVLSEVLDIENELGRKRVEKWGERLIDIDIIFYNNFSSSRYFIFNKKVHNQFSGSQNLRTT